MKYPEPKNDTERALAVLGYGPTNSIVGACEDRMGELKRTRESLAELDRIVAQVRQSTAEDSPLRKLYTEALGRSAALLSQHSPETKSYDGKKTYDEARLDWLEANKGAVEHDDTIEFPWCINTGSGQESGKTLRDAIDVARKANA